MSRDNDQVDALARNGQQASGPGDVVKDPFVLEFLNEKGDFRQSTGSTAEFSAVTEAVVGL